MPIRRILASFLILGAAACGPKPPPKPVAPPPPPDVTIGGACQPSATAGMEGHCASGLSCLAAGGASFCASPCPCGVGSTCVATPAAPEVCYKSCESDADCGGGMTCHPEWKACGPAGLIAAKAPACSEEAPERKSFGSPTPVSTSEKAAHDPAVSFDREGNLVVVHAVGGADSKLSVDVPLERQNAGDPSLARDRTGKLFLAALGWNGGVAETGMMVGVSTSDDGATFGPVVASQDASTDCPGDAAGCIDKPLIVIGPDRDNQKLDVIYTFYWSNVTNSLRVTHSIDGGQSFSSSVQVGTGAFADADVTSSGKLHVVYVSGAGDRLGDTGNGVYYTSSSDSGETFSPATRISSESEPAPYWFSSPRVVVDLGRRMLYAVYTSGTPDGKWDIILAASKDGGVTWPIHTKVNDDASCATHMLPAAALDPSTGKIHVIWLDNRAGSGSVSYAACSAGGGNCGKNETVSEAPFAAFGFGRRSAATLGDYLALVYNAKQKMLQAIWTQPVDENGAAVSRLFQATAKAR